MKNSLIKKYVDKYYDGERDVAFHFTLIIGVLGICIALCLVVLLLCIFVGGQ